MRCMAETMCLHDSASPEIYGDLRIVLEELRSGAPDRADMDLSWRVATYSSDKLMKAIRHAILVADSHFVLQGLIENEETRRYEWYVAKPEIELVA